MADFEKLKKLFHQEMISNYDSAAKIGYYSTRELQLINGFGGVEAAKRLIFENRSEDLTKLRKLNRLDLSVEALILKLEYYSLFGEAEFSKARKSLADLEIRPIPEIRPIKINLRNVIRGYMAGYAGGAAVARELVQNADDARGKWINFDFQPGRLVVSNGSKFSESDFNAICEIAAGSKRDKQTMVGTWGTGFLSVYQLTDHPIVHSSGRSIKFDLSGNGFFHQNPSSVIAHTEFHFEWRTQLTEVARDLGTDIWTESRINQFQEDMSKEIYRILPFLRDIHTIRLLEKGVVKYQVSREKVKYETLPNNILFERWKFNYRYGEKSASDEWVFYKANMASPFEEAGVKVKDPAIAVGFCMKQSGPGAFPGTLYNYLPTDIDTGFKFHINGDFFPDSNRKSILKDDGSTRSDWNYKVINGLGMLISLNLTHLRDLCDTPTAFYRLLPIKCNEKHDFLQPIVEQFKKAAVRADIIRTTDELWNMPGQIKLIDNSSRLYALVKDNMQKIAPTNLPQEVQAMAQEMGAKTLQPEDYFRFLTSKILDGTSLANAPTFINTREKLYKVFDYLLSLPKEQRGEVIPHLNGTPICLDERERLWAFGRHNLVWLSEEARRIVPSQVVSGDTNRYKLVDSEFNKHYHSILESLLSPFTQALLVDILNQIKSECMGRSIAAAHQLLNSREKLKQALDYLSKETSLSLTGLPLVIDEQHTLRDVGGEVYLADEETRKLLKSSQYNFVAPEFNLPSVQGEYLKRVGVQFIGTSQFVRELKKIWELTKGVHPLLNNPEALKQVYSYLYRRNSQLTEHDRVVLRLLNIVMTQRGTLRAAAGQVQLSLPPTKALDVSAVDMDIIRQDYLVSEKVLSQETRGFFTQILGISELTPLEYIRKYIPPSYESELDDKQKFQVLHLLQDSLPLLKTDAGKEALAALRRVRLVRCVDEVYRLPGEVYFADSTFATIFPHGYNQPHVQYQIPVRRPPERNAANSNEPVPESSRWYALFDALGLQKYPTAQNLVETVQRTISLNKAPNPEATNHIRSVYSYINNNWVNWFEREKDMFQSLRNLYWLPADGDNSTWYQPHQLYWAGLRYLIESQAKILSFQQNRREFSDFIGLNVEAKLNDVVNHLLYLSQTNKPVEDRLYLYLNSYADKPEIEALKGKAVIYNASKTRYWLPQSTFIGNYFENFGDYRCYLSLDETGNYAKILTTLGVRTQPDPVEDYIAVLGEIAQKPLEELDVKLVNRAYIQLSKAVKDNLLSKERLTQFKEKPLVIDKATGSMITPQHCYFNNQPDLLEKFEIREKVRVADFASNEAIPFLDALGLRNLSEVVRRRKHSVGAAAPEHDISSKIRLLNRSFKRIQEHHRKRISEGWRDLNWVKTAQVRLTNQIRVQYVIPTAQGEIQGRIESAEVFFDENESVLYLVNRADSNSRYIDIAHELSRMLNPALDVSTLSPLLKELLKNPPQEAEKLLDSYKVATLPYTEQDLAIDTELGKQAGTGLGQKSVSIEQPTSDEELQLPIPSLLSPNPISLPDDSESTVETAIKPDTAAVVSKLENDSKTKNIKPTAPENSAKKAVTNNEHIPVFKGRTKPKVPVIMTDYTKLARRYGYNSPALEPRINKLRQDEQLEQEELDLYIDDEQDSKVEEVRFVLSFMMRYEGFLPLTARLDAMLEQLGGQFCCRTDSNEEFPLYLDRQRQIIYNQDKLPAFFAANNIPAGGVVYLRLIVGNLFQIYYNPTPHIVRDVRLAEIDEEGNLVYTIVPEMEIMCESDDLVFISETRLGDKQALFLDAVGKKSIFDTLIDVFETAAKENRTWLSEHEIFTSLFRLRMISSRSISSELFRRPCFIRNEQGEWSFDSSRLFAIDVFEKTEEGDTIVFESSQLPARVTLDVNKKPVPQPNIESPRLKPEQFKVEKSPPVEVDNDKFLADSLADVSSRLDSLDETILPTVLRNFEPPYRQFVQGVDTLFLNLQRKETINASPKLSGAVENALSCLAYLQEASDSAEYRRLLEDVMNTIFEHGLLDNNQELADILTKTSESNRDFFLQPILARKVVHLCEGGHFEQGEQLLRFYRDYSPRASLGKEFNQIEVMKRAYQYFEKAENVATPEEKMKLLQDALKLHPEFKQVRELFDSLMSQRIIPVKEDLERYLAKADLENAYLAYEILKMTVEENLPFSYQQNLLRGDLEVSSEMMLSALKPQINKLTQPSLLYAAASIFRNLSVEIDYWRRHKQTYFDTLVALGEFHIKNEQKQVAAIVLAAALHFNKTTLKIGLSLKPRCWVAQLYEQSGLWDLAYLEWGEAVTESGVKERPEIQRNQQAAERNRHSIQVSQARQEWQEVLNQFRNDKELVEAIGIEFIEEFSKKITL